LAKYNSIDTIPAKTFFTILESKNYQLLKPTKIDILLNKIYNWFGFTYINLEKIFVSIYDDFFAKSNNPEAKEYLRCTKEIAFIKYKIASLKQSIHFYWTNKTTKEMRLDFIKAMNKGYGIVIDENADFIDEVKRLLTTEIGILENDLTFEEINFKNMISNSKKEAFNYEANVVNLEGVLTHNIKDGVKLSKYIEYQKRAEKIVEAQKQKKNGK